MDFKKIEGYSICAGHFFQISQDEFLHCNHSYPRVITWIKGNQRVEKKIDYGTPFGVMGSSFFFKKDEIIKKAELINSQIVIIDCVKIEKGVKVFFKRRCLHYFLERDNNPNVSFAIPINEDYRSNYGIKFNISIDELNKYDIHVHGNSLFGMKHDHILYSSSIRRYQTDAEEYEKRELPYIYERSVIFNNWIFYMSYERDLVSVNMNDLSCERTKTNLEGWPNIVGIDENGTMNAQSYWTELPVDLLTAKLPEKYIISKWDGKK